MNGLNSTEPPGRRLTPRWKTRHYRPKIKQMYRIRAS